MGGSSKAIGVNHRSLQLQFQTDTISSTNVAQAEAVPDKIVEEYTTDFYLPTPNKPKM
jgi:hypothetical protein